MNKKDYYYKIYRKYKESGLISLLDKWYKFIFLNDEYGFNLNTKPLERKIYNLIAPFVDNKGSFIGFHNPNFTYWNRIHREYSNEKQRYKTCRKFIENMFNRNDYKYFFTFTIDNKHIDKYCNNVPLFVNYVKEYFKHKFTNYNSYVFNIDYGSFNGRLHIHCLLSSDLERLDFKKLQSLYKLGNLDIVRTYNNEFTALTKYINKFTFHSFKNTTLCKCVYSRKKRN